MTISVEDEVLRVSSDSLESDLGDRDSLESGPCSEDSLQITGDSLGRYPLQIKSLSLCFITEDLTEEADNTNLMHILDKDLERVIAEATKLQSQVLESIIGNKPDTGVREESRVTGNETSELMTDAEKQIRIHRSEKETFSKGIASIIYEAEKGENHDSDDINQTDEKHDEEKNCSVDEVIETSQTIVLDEVTDVNNKPTKVDIEDSKDKKATEQTLTPDRKTSEITRKNARKKSQNGVGAKKGPNFTVIGGQKVDLNTDKPQYLKLTLEQIQELAMKQKSGKIFLQKKCRT